MGQQYRPRPLTQITDQRFIDTGTLASKGDDTVGLEFAAIHKSLHVAAEAQKVWVRDAFNAAELAATNGDPDDNDVATGTALNGNPSFLGGYFEVGYFLTGETRGYKGGKWDRTKVLKPFNEGGWGAVQINGRVDYVDLERPRRRAPTTRPRVARRPNYVNGGKQLGLQASVIWNPVDWVRFMAQYGHIDVTGGPRAAGLGRSHQARRTSASSAPTRRRSAPRSSSRYAFPLHSPERKARPPRPDVRRGGLHFVDGYGVRLRRPRADGCSRRARRR